MDHKEAEIIFDKIRLELHDPSITLQKENYLLRRLEFTYSQLGFDDIRFESFPHKNAPEFTCLHVIFAMPPKNCTWLYGFPIVIAFKCDKITVVEDGKKMIYKDRFSVRKDTSVPYEEK